jgi:transcription factor SPN1
MLSTLMQVMTKRDLHDDLLDSGVLGVLKSWLEPLPDGNLPNVKASPECLWFSRNHCI